MKAQVSSHSLLILTGAFGLAAALTACFECKADLLDRVPSPNNELHAVRWYRSCGAMHSGTVGVNLLPRDRPFDADDPIDHTTVFLYRAELTGDIVDTVSHDPVIVRTRVSSRAEPTPVVPDTVAWTSNGELAIAYDDRRPVLRQMIRLNYIAIAFRSHRPAIARAPQN